MERIVLWVFFMFSYEVLLSFTGSQLIWSHTVNCCLNKIYTFGFMHEFMIDIHLYFRYSEMVFFLFSCKRQPTTEKFLCLNPFSVLQRRIEAGLGLERSKHLFYSIFCCQISPKISVYKSQGDLSVCQVKCKQTKHGTTLSGTKSETSRYETPG